ncbi:MAG: DNA-binding protein [Thermoplasmatota archaeon]
MRSRRLSPENLQIARRPSAARAGTISIIKRFELKRLSKERIHDAQVLFREKRYSAAFYLGGYSVECALKARIAKETRRHQFPDKDVAMKAYQHDLESLVGTAGLSALWQAELAANKQFKLYWNVVKGWKETSRYEFRKKAEANDLIEAAAEPRDGVLRWISLHW